MRLGICAGLNRVEEFLDAGFDYVEVAAVDLRERGSDLPIEVTNVFFPGSVKFFQDDSWREVGRATIEAASRAGVKLMCLGSGASRTAPEAGPAAESRFVEIAAELQAMAKPHGIQIAPESLNTTETNVGNDLGDLACGLREREMGYTADAYHVFKAEGPGPDWEVHLPYAPAHVHFAALEGRSVPKEGDPMLARFFLRLSKLGYDARASFEGSLGELSAKEAWERLRLWKS